MVHGIAHVKVHKTAHERARGMLSEISPEIECEKLRWMVLEIVLEIVLERYGGMVPEMGHRRYGGRERAMVHKTYGEKRRGMAHCLDLSAP